MKICKVDTTIDMVEVARCASQNMFYRYSMDTVQLLDTFVEQVEKWDDPANEDLILVKLRELAQRDPMTPETLKKIGILSAMLYNFEDEVTE